MDILFIDPPWTVDKDDSLWKNVRSCLPSHGLACVAAYLLRHGKTAEIIDCTAEGMGVGALESRLQSCPGPGFVGITCTTPGFPNALKTAEICRRRFPGAKIMMGGVHPTVLPGEALSSRFVDYVIRGEGEITALELVRGRNPSEIPGLSYKKNSGEAVHNADRPLIRDLDSLPFPAYHLLPVRKYRPAVGSYKKLPAMSLFTTRGCPGRCTFCYRTFRGTVRLHSARRIVDEIKFLQREYGIREIAFYDDAFTVSRGRVEEFCRLVIEEKIKVAWSCFTMPRYVDARLLGRMKEAGCHLILFGIESADERILENMNKKLSLEGAKEAVRSCKKAGIETRMSFLIGSRGETEETIKRSIDFAVESDPDEVQFNIVTAYPGTELFSWAKRNGHLLSEDWSKYNMSEVNVVVPGMDEKTLRKYYKLAHRRFYLRPGIILKRALRIRSLTQFLQEVKGLAAILRFLSSGSKKAENPI